MLITSPVRCTVGHVRSLEHSSPGDDFVFHQQADAKRVLGQFEYSLTVLPATWQGAYSREWARIANRRLETVVHHVRSGVSGRNSEMLHRNRAV